jgi:propionyl-CoA synthetase
VLKAGVDGERDGERIRGELVQRVREEVGAVASLRQVDIVPVLPKTRSGKILRKTMREMADGRTPVVPGTIEDAGVLETLAPVLRGPA